MSDSRADSFGDELFRAFVEGVMDYAIFALDLEGRVVHWNAGAVRVLGFEESEVLGKGFQIIFTAEDREAQVPEQELRTAATLGRSEDERWQLRKDGSLFWAHGIVSPLRAPDGTLRGYGKILRDRTDLKELQETLRAQTQALERAAEQKNVFLATLSHELRNPLTPLANCARLLRGHAQKQPQLVQIADMMDRQIAKIRRLVEDLLDVTRISRGKLELHKSRVDLVRLVGQVVESMRPLAEARRQEISVAVPPHPVPVDGDADRLDQVITNLVDNAIKYTAEGGTIALDLQSEYTEAVLRVRDSGFGIPHEHIGEIFNLFTQAHPALAQSGAGLGLGLPLVRNLVVLHGGTVQARSEGVGKGSEFTVRLPMSPAAEGASTK